MKNTCFLSGNCVSLSERFCRVQSHFHLIKIMKIFFSTMFGWLAPAFFLIFCASASVQAAQLQKIEHRSGANGEEVVLSFDAAVHPKTFTMNGSNPRMVFDFPDTQTGRGVRNLSPKSAVVKGLRVGVHRDGGLKTRLVMDLATASAKPSYSVSGNTVVIHLGNKAGRTAAHEEAPTRLQPQNARKKSPAQTRAPAAADQPASAPAGSATPKGRKKEQAKPAPPKTPESPAQESEAKAPDQKAATEKAEQDEPAAGQQTAQPGQPEASAPVASVDQQAPQAAATDPPYLSAIQFDPDSPKGELVQFRLNGFYPPVLRSVETGTPQVICEFSNLEVAPALEGPLKISGKLVQAIRMDKSAGSGKVRVFIELLPNKRYNLQQVFFKEDNFFVLIINAAQD